MDENKRFKNVEEELYWGTIQYFTYDDEKITDNNLEKLVNQLLNENEELKEERDYFERKKCEYFNKYNKKHLDNIQLKEENERLKQTIESICKDYETYHGMDIRNAEWFTAW